MSKRLLFILFSISLAFNLAFIGSLLWFHLRISKAKQRAPRTRERIELPTHVNDMRHNPQIDQLRSDFESYKLKLMEELAKQTLDEERILSIIDSSLVAQSDLEQSLGENLVQIRKQMTPDEAKDYFQSRAEHMKRRTEMFNRRHDRRNKNEEDNDNRPDARARRRRPPRPDSRDEREKRSHRPADDEMGRELESHPETDR
ncbi:MAG: periplasmic heavy metal sensor [Candidatus Cloacimonetes bacterium]|nr:periplasmic heavy metal sensor [Candidatus Cloacimonadota bacterium]